MLSVLLGTDKGGQQGQQPFRARNGGCDVPGCTTVSALGLLISLDQIILDKVLAVMRPRAKGRAAWTACTILTRDTQENHSMEGSLPTPTSMLHPWDSLSSSRSRKILFLSYTDPVAGNEVGLDSGLQQLMVEPC